MYSKDQEKTVFGLILLVAFTFHLSTSMALWNVGSLSAIEIALILANIVCIVGMGFYAQWVWKPIALRQAFRKVFFYEGLFLFVLGSLVLISLALTRLNF